MWLLADVDWIALSVILPCIVGLIGVIAKILGPIILEKWKIKQGEVQKPERGARKPHMGDKGIRAFPPGLDDEVAGVSQDQEPASETGVASKKDKKKRKLKRYITICVATSAVAAGVALILLFTMLNGGRRFSYAGLEFSVPEGYEIEIGKADVCCGLTVNHLSLTQSGEESAEMFIEYPQPGWDCYSPKFFFDSYSYHDDTILGGQRAFIYGEDGPSGIYLVDSQITIGGSLKHYEAMRLIAESVEWDYPTFNVPELLSGGNIELEGTWKRINVEGEYVRLYPDYGKDIFMAYIECIEYLCWGIGDGRMFQGEGAVTSDDCDLTVNVLGDGTEMSLGTELLDGVEGEYEKISPDPFYIVGSPSPQEIDWGEEPQLPEDDYAVSSTRSLMDAVISGDLTTKYLLFQSDIIEGEEEGLFASLRIVNYKILHSQKSRGYTTLIVQYENEMGAVHELRLVWEEFSTVSKIPYLCDWELDFFALMGTDLWANQATEP